MMKRTILALAAAAALLGTGPARAADPIKLRVGFPDPIATPWGQALTEFKRIVEAGSNGRINVQLFPSEQLGTIVEMMANVRVGAQEISVGSPAIFAQYYPRFEMLELPFLVTNWDEAKRMIDSKEFKDLRADASAKSGLIVYGVMPYGFRNINNSKRPINSLADLKGLKIRTQNSQAHIAAFRALGATPVAIPIGETYQAVQTGVVDGLENAAPTLVDNKFPEIAKYVSITRHLFGIQMIYLNPKFYEGLSADDRALLDRAMKDAEALNLKLAMAREENATADLKKLGAVINEVPPAVIADMKAAVKPVYESFGAKFQPELGSLQKAINP
jgi:tripartite ATP-independent transporter DctP family solute receptor